MPELRLQASIQTRRRQRGAATLVVVMLLFFIISLVAAYASRNLIFEQRTSANQYRSTQAIEAAEAGVEWALAMLNHQRITAGCQNGVAADSSFRDRYLNINTSNGGLTPRAQSSGGALTPTCVYNGATWDCSCPADGAPVLTAPTAAGVFPAFRVRFEQIGPVPVAGPPSQPGVIRLQSVGCTRLDDTCLSFDSQGVTNEGRAVVTLLVALAGNVASPPLAAVTARQAVDFGSVASKASVFNTNTDGSGITVQSGATIGTAKLELRGIPGTPPAQTLVRNDPALNFNALPPFSVEDRMFASVFNMGPTTFKEQPALVEVACAGTSCTADEVRAAIALNPWRPLWLPKPLAIATGDIGAAGSPVLLVIQGGLSLSASTRLFGLAYLRSADWVTAGSGQVLGAVVAEGQISGTGTPTIVHDPDLLKRLRHTTGSFVRVPGSWKDFR